MPDDPKENQVGCDGPSFQLPEWPDQPSMLWRLNKRHADFHAGQGKKLEEQLTETTLKMAMYQRESEAARANSIGNGSFEGAIDDAAKASALVRAEQARNAGQSQIRGSRFSKCSVQVIQTCPAVLALF